MPVVDRPTINIRISMSWLVAPNLVALGQAVSAYTASPRSPMEAVLVGVGAKNHRHHHYYYSQAGSQSTEESWFKHVPNFRSYLVHGQTGSRTGRIILSVIGIIITRRYTAVSAILALHSFAGQQLDLRFVRPRGGHTDNGWRLYMMPLCGHFIPDY